MIPEPAVYVVGTMDVYSAVDVAGLNRVSRQVLAKAAHAVAGMARHAAV
jgi:uncharacterized protein (UPF0261 family)